MLKTSVARPIQQLSVSPSGDFIAILTSHTCHVASLPSSSHLTSGGTEPLRLRTFQVGPTAHVLEQSPLVSALWHPLSPSGNCLVTITRDACVRLWELDRNDRSSFDEPSLAVDLKKLANASTAQADFSASKYGVNKGFSPDSVEMDVHASCFGGSGTEDESGWAAMTLWVAMGEGDVYALCPFLPSKWRATSTLLPSLSTSVVAKTRAVSHDPQASEDEKRVAEQQTRWLADVDEQDAIQVPGPNEFELTEVYARPGRPGPIPKLQGPFYVGADNDIGEITDIHVIAARLNDDSLYDDDEDMMDEESGLSVGVVCVATSTSKIHVCLDLDGVEAEWLPSKRAMRTAGYTFTDSDHEDHNLLVFETVDLSLPNKPDFDVEGWPTFTLSPLDHYEVLVTTPAGVYNLDFNPWTLMLENELAHASDTGAEFRLNVLLESMQTSLTQVIGVPAEPARGINAALAILEPVRLGGCLILTAATNIALSALLALPVSPSHPYAPTDHSIAPAGLLEAPEPRAPYAPAQAFWTASQLPAFARQAAEKHLLGPDLRGSVRYSSATLQLMTDAHRILAEETHGLGIATSDLFRRCERMRSELQDQIRRVRELREKREAVVGEYGGGSDADSEGEGGTLGSRDRIEMRVNDASERTIELNERLERLRKKTAKLGGGRELSSREKAWAGDVERMSRGIGLEGGEADGLAQSSVLLATSHSKSEGGSQARDAKVPTLAARLQTVHALHERLTGEVQVVVDRTKKEKDKEKDEESHGAGDAHGTEKTSSPAMQIVGTEFRRRKLAQVMELLARETALVEGVGERLARLSAV